METAITRKYPVYSPFFWSSYVVQMRPYLLFVSGVAGVMGLAMHVNPLSAGWKFYIAAIVFFFGYGFGQALTDCFQTDTDKLSAPYRPLSKQVISIPATLFVSSLGLIGSGFIFYLLHPLCFFLSLAAVVGLSTYSYVKKHFWFAGPLYNAWIVALLPVIGYYTCVESSVKKFPLEIISYVMVSFFSYANFVLIGYLKDIEADRKTRYKTFPVIFGWNKTVLLGDLFALSALAFFWTRQITEIPALIAGICATIIMVTGQLFGHFTKNKTEKNSVIPVTSTVRGFILLHLSLTLQFQPLWFLPALCFYGLFELALYFRPSKHQV
jgi:4-hydroxybenzoate polyprenyltransferase